MPFDLPEEALFVLIFLLISFFNWIGEKVKKAKMEAASRRPSVRGFEEEPPDFPTPPPPSRPAPQSRPAPARPQEPQVDPMRQILQSLGIPVEEEKPATPVATPPPLEQPPIPVATVVAAPTDMNPDTSWDFDQLTTEEQSHAFDHQSHKVEHVGRHPGKAARKLLAPQHAQTAFVLKEILDKPKCFDI